MQRSVDLKDWEIRWEAFLPLWGAALYAAIWLLISTTFDVFSIYKLWLTEDYFININRWFDALFVFIHVAFLQYVCTWEDKYSKSILANKKNFNVSNDFDGTNVALIFIAVVAGIIALIVAKFGSSLTVAHTLNFYLLASKSFICILIACLVITALFKSMVTALSASMTALITFGTVLGIFIGFSTTVLFDIMTIPLLIAIYFMPQIHSAAKRAAYEVTPFKHKIVAGKGGSAPGKEEA